MIARSKVEGRWVATGRLITLLSGPAIVGLISMAIASVTPRIASEIGGNDAALLAQLVMTLPALMVLLGAPLGGWLADRMGHRQVLLAALAVYAVSGTSGLFISGFVPLIASRLLLGLAGGSIQPVCLALIGRYYQGAERERVLGFVVTTSSVLAIGGLMLGGVLADLFGWRAAFSLYLLGAAVLILAVCCIAPDDMMSAEQRRDARAATMLVSLWPFYALVVLLGIGMFIPAIQAPFLLEARGMTGAARASLPASACAAVATLSSASYGLLRRGVSMRSVAALAALSMAIGTIVAGNGPGFLSIVSGCAAIGVGAGLVEPTLGAAILARAPEALHARAMGLLIAALYAGQFFNPLIFAVLRQGFGTAEAITAAGTALLLAGAIILISRSYRAIGGATKSCNLAR